MQIGQNQGVLERFGQKDNQGITLPLNSHSKSLQLYLIVCSCTCDLFLENLYFLWNIRKNHHIWWFSLELLAGFEPATSSLPRTCSTYWAIAAYAQIRAYRVELIFTLLLLTKDVLYLLSHSSLFNFIQRISYYAIIVKNLFIVKSKKGVFWNFP